jgi:hypothetical protein
MKRRGEDHTCRESSPEDSDPKVFAMASDLVSAAWRESMSIAEKTAEEAVVNPREDSQAAQIAHDSVCSVGLGVYFRYGSCQQINFELCDKQRWVWDAPEQNRSASMVSTKPF